MMQHYVDVAAMMPPQWRVKEEAVGVAVFRLTLCVLSAWKASLKVCWLESTTAAVLCCTAAQLHTLVCSLTGSACLPFAMLICRLPHNHAVRVRRPAADCAAAVQPQVSRRLHRTLSQP